MFLPPIEGVLRVFACELLVLVVYFDLTARRIPNALALILLVGGLAHGAFFGWSGLLGALFGGAAGFALLVVPYARGWMGAGDVKLLAAIGTWVGASGALMVLLIGSLLGGVLALISLATLARDERKQVQANLLGAALLRGLAVPEPSKISRARGVPFGVPLSLVAATVLAHGVLS